MEKVFNKSIQRKLVLCLFYSFLCMLGYLAMIYLQLSGFIRHNVPARLSDDSNLQFALALFYGYLFIQIPILIILVERFKVEKRFRDMLALVFLALVGIVFGANMLNLFSLMELAGETSFFVHFVHMKNVGYTSTLLFYTFLVVIFCYLIFLFFQVLIFVDMKAEENEKSYIFRMLNKRNKVVIFFFTIIPICCMFLFGTTIRKSLIAKEVSIHLDEPKYEFYGMSGEGRLYEKVPTGTCSGISPLYESRYYTSALDAKCLDKKIAWHYLLGEVNIVSLHNNGELSNGDSIIVTPEKTSFYESKGLKLKVNRKVQKVNVTGLTPYYEKYDDIPQSVLNEIFAEIEKSAQEYTKRDYQNAATPVFYGVEEK